MLKKFSTLVLVGLLAIPTVALADSMEDRVAALEESAESWDKASRIHWSGDFRVRADWVSASSPSHYTALDISRGVVDMYDGDAAAAGLFGLLTPAEQLQLGGIVAAGFSPATVQQIVGFMRTKSPAMRAGMFGMLGYMPEPETDYENDTIYTNRLRLNMRTKVMENVEVKARLAMYKVWGMQNNAVDYSYNNGLGGGPFMLSSLGFDGSATRQPQDSIVRVDRAFMNWNNIGDMPIWFSIGRRPVTDGPPAHIRMGVSKMATPVAYMDYPFDGFSLGYAYENLFGIEDLPGRVRFCYGRGFEAGPVDDGGGLSDVDFGGISWDVFKKGDRFFNFQSFGAWNMFNVPDNVNFVNPLEYAAWEEGEDNDGVEIANYNTYDPLDPSRDLILNRANLGDIYHTSSVYMSKFQDLNYFVTAGWSHTVARGMDELGTSLLGHFWETPTDRDGYSLYAGVRYDLDDAGLKLGAEVNWGSEYWISFTPGHDDLYASKLATRGNVIELYGIYDLPAGDAISSLSRAFIRFGYQHYEYDYTGSGFWLGAPVDMDELAGDPLNAQFFAPVDSMDQIYLTMEAWF